VESITKNGQPEETLRAMAARAYGLGQVPAAGEDWVCELGHGWFNVAYLIRLRDGSRVVLKNVMVRDGDDRSRAASSPPSFLRSATRRRS